MSSKSARCDNAVPMASSVLRSGLQLSDAAGEPVWHPCPHIDPRVDPSSKGALNIPKRIIEQYFVATYVNANGWHARKLSVEWRSQ